MSGNTLLHLLATCLSVLPIALSGPSSAQDYPTRPVRLIIGIAPGSSASRVRNLLKLLLRWSAGAPRWRPSLQSFPICYRRKSHTTM